MGYFSLLSLCLLPAIKFNLFKKDVESFKKLVYSLYMIKLNNKFNKEIETMKNQNPIYQEFFERCVYAIQNEYPKTPYEKRKYAANNRRLGVLASVLSDADLDQVIKEAELKAKAA